MNFFFPPNIFFLLFKIIAGILKLKFVPEMKILNNLSSKAESLKN